MKYLIVMEGKIKMIYRPPMILLMIVFILGSGIIKGQEEICIPQTWVGKKVKGVVYKNNGDSISGKFTHLTPRNDYYTTHILFESKTGVKGNINRAEIVSYFDKKEKDKRYKIYPNVDSVFVKKKCHFDMGVFMVLVEDGPYKLLQDILLSNSSIQAYNQSESNDIYYLLPPNKKLLELNRNDLKPQLQSLFSNYPGTDQIFSEPNFNIESASKVIHLVNTSILME